MCTKSVGVMRVSAPLVMVLLLVTSVAPVHASDPVPGIDIALDDIIFFPRQKQKDEIRKTLVEAGVKEEGVKKILDGLDDLVQASELHNSSRKNVKLTMTNAGVSDGTINEILSMVEAGVKEEGVPAQRKAKKEQAEADAAKAKVRDNYISTLVEAGVKEEGVKGILVTIDDLVQFSVDYNSSRSNVKGIMKDAGVPDGTINEILSMVEAGVKEEGVPSQGRKRPGLVKYEDIRKTLVEDGVKEESVKGILVTLDDYAQEVENHNSSRSNKTYPAMRNAGVPDETIEEILSMVEAAVKEESGPAQVRKCLGMVMYEDIRKTLVEAGVKEEGVKGILVTIDDMVQFSVDYNSSRSNVKFIMKNAGVSDDKIEEIVRRVEEGVQVRGLVKYEDIRKTLVEAGVKEESIKGILVTIDDMVQCHNASRENVKLTMKNAGVSDELTHEIMSQVEVAIEEEGVPAKNQPEKKQAKTNAAKIGGYIGGLFRKTDESTNNKKSR